MTTAPFQDVVAEEGVLSFVLQSFSNLQECIDKLDSSLLEDKRNKALLQSIQLYYERYQGLLDEKGFEVLLDEASIPVEKKIDYQTLFTNLKTRSITKPQFLLSVDVLRQLKQKRTFFDIAKEISDQLKDANPNIQKLTESIVSRVLDVRQGDDRQFREESLKDSYQARIAEYKDREVNPYKYLGIPFGIKKLDELTSGIFPEEFGLFFGRSGSGKSRTLASIAYNMFSSGRSVMYVTIEMPKSQVGRLFDSRHFLISATGLRHGKLSDPEKKKFFGGTFSNHGGDFYVVDAPQSCSFADLLPVIRRYKARYGRLDAVIIDYLNLMRPSSKDTGGNESLRIGTIGKELKILARLEKVAVLSATTATRSTTEVDDIDDVGTEHVGWSDLLVYQCDLMIFLKKGDSTNSLTKTVEGIVAKYRDGANQRITLGVDWDKSFVGDIEQYLKLVGAISAPAAGPLLLSTSTQPTTDKPEKTVAATKPPDIEPKLVSENGVT